MGALDDEIQRRQTLHAQSASEDALWRASLTSPDDPIVQTPKGELALLAGDLVKRVRA